MNELHQVESWQTTDPRFSVPLCIIENRLEGDALSPDSPTMARSKYYSPVLSSPTSVVEVVDSLPGCSIKILDGKSKKEKKLKRKLFLSRRSRKNEDEENDAAKMEAMRTEALQLKRIRDEEDADFDKLRAEEESSPKLDMLARYPLTIIEEVLSLHVPPSPDLDKGWQEAEAKEPEVIVEGPKVKVVDLGRFEKQVQQLRLSKMDLRQFVSTDGNFSRMQQELRDCGVITDETLRQKQHLLCRPNFHGEHVNMTECLDIFSIRVCRKREWNSNLPMAYRRMNEFSTQIDWKQEVEHDSTFPSATSQESMKTKKNWSDVRLLNLVSNYSKKGRDSYHNEFHDGVEESDMLVYDRNLQDGVDLLTYCVHDLVPIVQEHEVFANLQAELRKIGAVTNEVLKQGLHFYVRDVRLQKERKEAEIRVMDEKKARKEDEPHDDRGAEKRKPLRTKLRLR